MKKYIIFIIAFAVIIAALIDSYFLFYQNKQPNSNPNSQNLTTTPASVPSPTLVYPITQFSDRITANDFGQYWPTGGSTNPDIMVCAKATYYVGFHTANDLETFASEQNTPVPVYAIAAGTVQEAGPVSGYGGLTVLKSTINGQVYTVYYGHIDLSTKKVSAGDSVSAGQKIAELGPACSSANGDVRKHLHFGMHLGDSIDVHGYVQNKSDLSAWINPKKLLSSLQADNI